MIRLSDCLKSVKIIPKLAVEIIHSNRYIQERTWFQISLYGSAFPLMLTAKSLRNVLLLQNINMTSIQSACCLASIE
jgi:hypothetical protein